MTTFNGYGLPGVRTERTATPRRILWGDLERAILPAGVVVDGAKSRDPLNTGDTDTLRAGLLMGKITTGGKYAPAIIGLSAGALTSTGTTLASSAATATELVRRIGTTGTFNLVGPPTAAGTVRTLTATYSAVNTTTGDITITALGADEVQNVTLGATMTAGTIEVTATKSDGTLVTAKTAWNTSSAQTVTDLQTALNALLGTSAVACAVYATNGVAITFSGTNYAKLPQPLVTVEQISATTTTNATVARATAGVDGRFVTASFIMPTDGSQTPLGLIDDGYNLKITDVDGANLNAPLPNLLVGGTVIASQILNYPADAALKAWLKAQLRANGIGYLFDDDFR